MLGQALALIYFPARLLLRKLEGEGSKYFAGSVDLKRRCHKPRNQVRTTRELAITGAGSAHLFDLGEESVEVLALGTVLFIQSGLHQTPEAKSVVNTHYTATMRALVVLMLRCPKRFSKAV
jgi:hypothetical protein